MPRLEANGIRIEYATFGDRSAPPLLLVRGLGTQLIHWDRDLLQAFVDRGHFVVIFDNRDAGLTQEFAGTGTPDLADVIRAREAGVRPPIAYTLEDMADDVAGLLDGLALDTAHLLGISMGGGIAQLAAARHPQRISSLISVMSGTGNPALPPPSPEATAALMQPAERERSAYLAQAVESQRVFSGPHFDPVAFRALARRAFDRSFRPEGIARQMAAIVANGDRRAVLADLKTPTLVIHGRQDSLIPQEHGVDTAETIPGAELVLIDGMGHDIPRAIWPEFVDAVCARTGRGVAARA